MKFFRNKVKVFTIVLVILSGEIVASQYVKKPLTAELYKTEAYTTKKTKKQKPTKRIQKKYQKWTNPVTTRIQLEAERARRLARPVPMITIPLQAQLIGEKFKGSYQKFSKNFTQSQEYIRNQVEDTFL